MPDSQKLRRVFVVDDEPLIASTLAMILSNSGFNAIAFSKPLRRWWLLSLKPPTSSFRTS